jgi:hypothetical protein
LERGIEQYDQAEENEQLSMPLHDNIRGEDYYQ